MKVLVVLALAVFTSCHVDISHADEPKPQIDVLYEALWQNAIQGASATLNVIRRLNLGPKIEAGMETVFGTLEELVHPMTKELIDDIATNTLELAARLIDDLRTLSTRTQPQVLDMAVNVAQWVEQLKQKLAPYAESVDAETLNILGQRSEELMTSLEQTVREVETQLAPYTEELKKRVDYHLQNFKDNVVPVAQKVQEDVFDRTMQMRAWIAPYAEDCGKKLKPYAQAVHAQVTSTYRSFIHGN